MTLPAPEPPIVVGRLAVQPDQVRGWLDGEPLKLTVGCAQVLGALARRPDVLFSRAQLLDVLDVYVADRSIDGYVKNIRKALREVDPDAGEIIATVYGVGYRLDPEACGA
ncbi:winged helix-turn-helix domain-containing protein [Jannaschia formosa]|uniref:winged helix-turn-helix domain-containing protein n=1 Tax=Jannaschia formosa TaxID=2259592 RepID=UPI0014306D3B|nr:winged helix-turn-helix domain-containing protein [Jannaschia formosa]